jgi:hypothetical protein
VCVYQIAAGVGDKTIRLVDTAAWVAQSGSSSSSSGSSSGAPPLLLWRGLQSMVTAVCWHPRQEGLLAFGTAEGRVGVYDVFAVRNHTPLVWGVSLVRGPVSAAPCQALLNVTYNSRLLHRCTYRTRASSSQKPMCRLAAAVVLRSASTSQLQNSSTN